MPSSKRKTRRKAADVHETSEIERPESSPSRPSPKKRKITGGRSATQRRTLSPPPPLKNEHEDSDDESETVSNSDLVDSVISYLQVAKEAVVASTEYSNEKAQPENKVSAYAKIAGRDWTYFVVDQAVNIGRPPDNNNNNNSSSSGNRDGNMLGASVSSPIADMKEMLPVHIDLGPSKIVSRHHASIFYDADYPDGGGWHVRVNGRNGVKVNTNLLKRGGIQKLKSGDILEIAGTQMMFVTPGDKVTVDPYFVERAKVLATGEEFNPVQHGHPDPTQHSSYISGNLYPTSSSRQALAPAPPDFKRAMTPPISQKDGKLGVFDSKPPASPYNRGMLIESTHEIDYSRDAAKDLKPPFSYATMIAQAIFSSDEEKLTLNNIYGWIQDKYAFYRHSNSGWQNSIRHNLSLNKAFQKVPRRTDEPGKGMKWQIAPEFREEYWKKQARRGVPASSSVPTSPASGAGKDINPNFRGPNGQNLGYDTSMVGTFPARDIMPIPPVPPHPASRNTFHPFSSSQPPPPPEAFTPERRQQRTDTQNTVPDPDFDDSPFRSGHFNPNPTPVRGPAYTLPSSVPPPQRSPANPTLSSSYLDTPHNIITPAPLRQNPRLAPPSTLVAPSKFMPDSSPAGGAGSFWKGLMSGDTPAHGLLDMSPVKANQVGDGENDGGRGVLSSSPPPMDGLGDGMSPSKPARSSQALTIGPSSAPQMSREEQSAKARTTNGTMGSAGGDDDDEGGMGGFDLARGFQPIGSFHSHSSQSHAHGHGHIGNNAGVNANAARMS